MRTLVRLLAPALALAGLSGIAAGPPRAAGAGVLIARLKYDGGGDWYGNPSSLPNLARALRERTPIPVDRIDEARVSDPGRGPLRLPVPLHERPRQRPLQRRRGGAAPHATSSRAGSCSRTTTTGWTRASAGRWRASSPTGSWSRSPSTTRSTTASTICRRPARRRSTSTTASRPRGSGSSTGTGSSSSTPTSPTSATGSRIRRCTTIRPRSGRTRCGWRSTSSSTP